MNIYTAHEENSKTSDFLNGEIVAFNREKRRNGINWLEIYVKERKHIKKTSLKCIF
jgi:hypothetical protein